ncbi:MAG TPA: Asp-tRNA(Asn)/Glu-tRNA(Gln) amidotransferase subunit GatB, partial [bacterium]
PPNTQTCPTCLGFPGSLPVLNARAVELGLRTAAALDCHAHAQSRFHRKNYYYPDLPKNYQITQYEYKIHPPLATEGGLELPFGDGGARRIRVRRVHLEEDTARLVHADPGAGYSLIDFNRAGVPLMEVVTEPDLRSPGEARLFLSRLRAVLQAIEVSTGRMEEGSLRCDANISLRRVGGGLGTRTEVKNMNSLRSVERALGYEAARQQTLLMRGEPVVQETRHWDERRGVTFASRTKEEAQDYRYFPEPDLVPIALSEESIAQIRAALPELPDARRRRYVERYGLTASDAALVTSSQAMAALFEETVRLHPNPRAVSNWLTGDLSGYLNAEGMELEDVPVTGAHLAELLDLVEGGTISGRTAKEILPEVARTGRMPREVVASKDLRQISDGVELAGVVDAVLADNSGPAADYRAGKAAALTFLVGQAMKRTRGRANPEAVNRLLRERLGG